MISYAQNFEDVILSRVFKGKKNGFYIDVGAWHPIDHSVTKHFYDQNWSGINIEPSNAYYSLLQKLRSRDINLNFAVNNDFEQIDYLEIPNSGASSSIHSVWDTVAKQGNLAKNAIKRKVKCMKLADICSKYANDKEIDFIKIDVEGAELSVIQSANWNVYRPIVIIVESVTPFTNISNHSDWEEILINSRYIFAYFDGLNRFYVREESKDLMPILSVPPNVFDNFKLYDGEGRIFHKKIRIGRLNLTVSL